jgi:hypothetical protein
MLRLRNPHNAAPPFSPSPQTPKTPQLKESSKISMLRNATWTLSNFCRGKPPPNFAVVRGCGWPPALRAGVLAQISAGAGLPARPPAALRSSFPRLRSCSLPRRPRPEHETDAPGTADARAPGARQRRGGADRRRVGAVLSV